MLIDLHTHLEGRVRPETAAALGAELGLPTPASGWREAIQLDGPADLTVYLTKVAATYPFFRSYEHVRRVAAEAVEDAAAAGLDHIEFRFGPGTHTSDAFPLVDVVGAACEGLRDAAGRTGVGAGIVVAALRHHPAALNEEVARAAARHAGDGVVGFDLAGDELLFPALAPHVAAFRIAEAAGLGLTCHAAEAAPGAAAIAAVDLLHASRIGHGAHVASDPVAVARLRDAGTVIEVCPTSNWYTGAIARIEDHPAPVFREAGIALVLGDDNPMQTRSGLASERRVLGERLGFDEEALRALDATSVAAVFASDVDRARLRARLRG